MTDRIVLQAVEEFNNSYQAKYAPFYSLFLDNSQSYSEGVGQVDFKQVKTVGDIRAKHIGPKDTEMRRIAVSQGSKTFKKYFLANQFTQSNLQDQSEVESIVAQVLDEHQKQADELLLFGDGTAPGNQINNGLFYSSDENYTLKSSVEIDTTADPLLDMYGKVLATYRDGEAVAGQKAIIFYGEDVVAKSSALFATQPTSFRQTLQQAIPDVRLVNLPKDIAPAGQSGWILVNLEQVKLHLTALPQLKAQGVNEEKMYTWHNFIMGSMMLEVLAPNALIRQPATFEVVP